MSSVKIGLMVFIIAFALMTGCTQQSEQPAGEPPNAGSETNSNAAPAEGTSSGQNAGSPITFPLIDAMFADEQFASEAAAALELSNDDLTKIKDLARNEVLKLGSDTMPDEIRSTRASVERTRSEIEKILGKERTDRFFAFVRTRWNGDIEGLSLLPPNEVPTDTRIVINSPAYRMDLFKDGQLIKTYKIGIGYPEFPLPTGLRKAKEIIFNPTWTPPDEPWVKGKVAPGEKIEAGSKLNPLGPVKVPIGLPSLIHGGKDPSKLGTFASHGCAGLTNTGIQDFALQLSNLSGQPIAPGEIKAYETNKTETKNIKLNTPVPVELRYETIVVENGIVLVYRDVYERGTNTEENLRKVLQVYGVSFDSLPETDRTNLLNALAQMALDAAGDKVSDPDNDESKRKQSRAGKVTRTIKGNKEVSVAISALEGKGYPAPVDLVVR